MELISRNNRRRGNPQNKAKAAGTLEKGLALLEWLSRGKGEFTLMHLANAVSLPPSTTHRILAALGRLGYVEQDQETRHYRLGHKAVGFAASILQQIDMLREARSLLQNFVSKTGESITLATLEDKEVLVIEKVEVFDRPRLFLHIGRRAPVHSTALGKVLLAGLPDREVLNILRRTGMPRLTPNTIVSPKQFLHHLRRVRQLGYAIDDEETVLGARCLAVPVYNHLGRVIGALSSSGPTSIWTDRYMKTVLRPLRNVAHELSVRLGYSPWVNQ